MTERPPLPSFKVDPATLREVLDDEPAARAHVADLEAAGPTADAERVAWLRMLGDLDAAEALGWKVLARAGGPASDAEVRAGLRLEVDAIGAAARLASVLHWRARFADADALFDAARDAAARHTGDADPRARRQAAVLRCFVDHNQGKARLDADRPEEAFALFEATLAGRRALGAPADQVAAAVQAMAVARIRMG